MRIHIIYLLSVFSLALSAQPKVVAHRGASQMAPENTVASVQMAYLMNADAAEIDVYLSADEEVMVNHDKNTYRTSAGTSDYLIAETNSDVLSQVDVGAWKDPKFKGETMPFLRDILVLVPAGKRLVIEIKCGPEIIPALQKVIAESGKLEQCDFISFSWETICQVHTAFPNNASYFLKMMPFRLRKSMKDAAEVGLTGVNLYYKIINKRRMAYAQELGLDVWCWTVDAPKVFNKMKKLGLSAITTNCPSLYTSNKYRLPSE